MSLCSKHLFCGLVLLGCSGGSGAGALAQPSEVPEMLDLNFSVYSFQRLKGLNFLNPHAQVEKLSFFSSSRSPRHHYSGPNPIVFFRETPEPSPQNPSAVRRVSVAEARIPPGMRDPMLVFFRDTSTASASERYLVYPFDDSLRNLPAGHIVFFNVSGYELRGYINREVVRLRTGPSQPYSVRGSSIGVSLGVYVGEKYRQSFASPIAVGNDQRAIAFFFPPYLAGSPEVQPRILLEDLDRERQSEGGEQ